MINDLGKKSLNKEKNVNSLKKQKQRMGGGTRFKISV